MQFIVKLFLICALSSLAYANVKIEILKIQITKVETQIAGGGDLLYYAYGDVYRRLVNNTGRNKRQNTLHKVFLGELRDMRRLAKMNWYFVGSIGYKERQHFKWGRTYRISGKEYTRFLGVRNHSTRKSYRYRQNRNRFNDNDDHYEQDGGGYDNTYENDYENDTYDDRYEDENYGDNNRNEYDGEDLSSNDYEQDDLEEYYDEHGEYDENNDEYDEYGGEDNRFSTKVQRLAYLLASEQLLEERVKIFQEYFSRISEGHKGLAKKIDRALQDSSQKTQGIFFSTAIQNCIKTGNIYGFSYYLSRLHKLVSDKKSSVYARNYKDGSRYLGEWVSHQRHGYGVLTKENGSRYLGQWRYNKRNGVGLYEWSDGSFYIGDWNNGQKQGYGTLVSAQGFVSRQGWWRNNRFLGKNYFSALEQKK
ncbi:hypothetical protein [Candidatus Uabimicrobium sp. HlEnr_7]|uniref:hypothetical protein n=1 Tax=Candidatus Uabimicrobium helgolandensis TaxID=3095367 RepID=UPI003558A74F